MSVLVTPASLASPIVPNTEEHFLLTWGVFKAPDDRPRPGYVFKAP